VVTQAYIYILLSISLIYLVIFAPHFVVVAVDIMHYNIK
jgi:hypothetical protein